MASQSIELDHTCRDGTVLAHMCLLSQVRRWDAQTLVNTDTHNSNKALYCIAAVAGSASVAYGGADRAWRLWDRRQSRKEDMVTPHQHQLFINALEAQLVTPSRLK